MPLLAALWLALLAVLAAAPAPRLAGPGAAEGPARGVDGRPSRPDPASPEEAIRVPRPPRALGAARVEVPDPHAPPPLAAPSPPFGAGVAVVAGARAARQPSHAPAALGGVLPYFPTAPPLQN